MTNIYAEYAQTHQIDELNHNLSVLIKILTQKQRGRLESLLHEYPDTGCKFADAWYFKKFNCHYKSTCLHCPFRKCKYDSKRYN